MTTPRRFDAALVVGGLLGFLGVATGAMGAHALKGRLDAQALDWWRTAAQYAQIHAVLMVAVALACPPPRSRWLRTALVSLGVGVVIFAGTLDAMALGAPRRGIARGGGDRARGRRRARRCAPPQRRR